MLKKLERNPPSIHLFIGTAGVARGTILLRILRRLDLGPVVRRATPDDRSQIHQPDPKCAAGPRMTRSPRYGKPLRRHEYVRSDPARVIESA